MYNIDDAKKNIDKLVEYDKEKLKKYISKSRQDTIQDGALILINSLEKLSTKKIVVSQMGVREGVFLSDLLRNFNLRFPVNFKLNQKVLLDRFAENIKVNNYYQNIANKLYTALYDDKKFEETISFCSKLLLLNNMNFYSWIEYLNFGYTHNQKVTIAYLMQSFSDEELDMKLYKKYEELLPTLDEIKDLFFILNLTSLLARDMNIQKVEIKKEDKTLFIKINITDLTKEAVYKLDSPYKITIF